MLLILISTVGNVSYMNVLEGKQKNKNKLHKFSESGILLATGFMCGSHNLTWRSSAVSFK